MEQQDIILKVQNLRQYFKVRRNVIKAVDDISFEVKRGEVFGLVGESGCGKTTTGRTIIKLYEPTSGNIWFNGYLIGQGGSSLKLALSQAKKHAQLELKDIDRQEQEMLLASPDKREDIQARHQAMRQAVQDDLAEQLRIIEQQGRQNKQEQAEARERFRDSERGKIEERYHKRRQELETALRSAPEGERAALEAQLQQAESTLNLEKAFLGKSSVMNKMQMIFQDPIASINPRMTVREIIAEGLIIRGVKDKQYIDQKVYEVLDRVGLLPEHAVRYPHEFSGGQRQRIGIARAIILEPDLIIADEPISALDVSIQAQVINLLNDLRKTLGLTILFIAHNLSVVKYFSDRIAVMYYGKIVELASSQELFERPLHPYTKSLLSAIPYPDPHYEKQRKRVSYVPSLMHDYTVDKPSMQEVSPGHYVYCNQAELSAYRQQL